MTENPAIVVVTAMDLVVLAAITGAVASDLWILPPPSATQEALSYLRVTIWRMCGFCLIALACTTVAGLMLRAADMSDLSVWAVLPVVGTVVRKTHYGQLWSWRAVAWVVLAVSWAARRGRIDARSIVYVAFAAVVVMIFCLSASGHAGDEGLLSVASVATTLHILGGFLWGGGIICSALIIFPVLSRIRPSAQDLMAETGLRLSTLSGLALALVLVPGFYNAWSLVGGWRALWSSVYGQLLLVKITLAGAMMLLGAVNRYIYVPALQRAAHRPVPRTLLPIPHFLHRDGHAAAVMSFMRSMRVEGTLLLVVLFFAAALSQQSPPAHADHVSAHNGGARYEAHR